MSKEPSELQEQIAGVAWVRRRSIFRGKIINVRQGIIPNKFMLEISPFSSNKEHQIELVESVIQALEWVIQE